MSRGFYNSLFSDFDRCPAIFSDMQTLIIYMIGDVKFSEIRTFLNFDHLISIDE